jgi:lytic murein transglycosylase
MRLRRQNTPHLSEPRRHLARAFRLCLVPALLVLLPFLAPRPAQADEVAAYRAAVEHQFALWLAKLWPQAQAAGVDRAAFDRETAGLKLEWSLPLLVLPDRAFPGGPALPAALKPAAPRHQPEFGAPAGYFGASSLNRLAAEGKAEAAKWAPQLAAIQARFHVPGSIVLAIWGRETGFGQAALPYDALSAIATQAFLGTRPDKFRQEFIDALLILQRGQVSRAAMRSSWAGAMGDTQFLPSDVLRYGVDFDGDGKVDIWSSTPDALASTANSLHSQGWNGAEPWGYEVVLPEGFDCSLQGPDRSRSFADWVKLGVRRVRGRTFPPGDLDDRGFLVLPAGMKGPAFLVTGNFGALKRYNNSDVYALFVSHLSDMIAYGAPAEFVGAWLPVDRFTRARMLAMQKALVAQGYKVGKVDGLVGFKTRQAIGLYEKKIGAPQSCYPSQPIVAKLLGGG